MSSDWHPFDKVYCISVEERSDRRQEARAQFAKVGLADRVEFVVVPKHPTDCEQGVYESHLICMAKGIKAGAEYILIFEDDICFDRFKPEALKDYAHFMTRHKQWNMLFLGCMVKGSRATDHPSVRRIRYRSLTHAYVIRRAFAQKLLDHYPWHQVPYDDFLRDFTDQQMYATSPMIAFQSNSRSDNERYLPLDRFRRLCGGLIRLQKFDEFFFRYKWWVISSNLLALIFLWWVI